MFPGLLNIQVLRRVQQVLEVSSTSSSVVKGFKREVVLTRLWSCAVTLMEFTAVAENWHCCNCSVLLDRLQGSAYVISLRGNITRNALYICRIEYADTNCV
jgi:hypothetical protein